MDLYEKKFAEMQKYIPFLEAMIERLKKVKDNSRESQLQKMQSLHGILSNSNGKKLTIDKLYRCEEVLLKLHNKVDKGNASGTLQTVKKEPEDVKDVKIIKDPPEARNVKEEKVERDIKDVKPIITGNSETKPSVGSSVDPERGKELEMSRYRRMKSSHMLKTEKEETPASPSPPASPDNSAQSGVASNPIIIPTERSGTPIDRHADRPASPDPCELIATIGMRKPIVIPTERAEDRPKVNPLTKTEPETSSKISSLSNYSDNKPVMPPNVNLWQSSRRANGSDRGPSALRHIPTVPTPSKGSSLIRKPVLILEKNPSDTDSPTSRWESPKTNFPDRRSISPDRDSHNQRSSTDSPKSKESAQLSKLPATSLLVSPPSVLRDPPLTKEDLAELLQDASENRSAKKSQMSKDKDPRTSERPTDDPRRSEKPSSSSSRDNPPKIINLTQNDDDPENERQWQEKYKHIVKMPSRRVFTSPSGTPSKHFDARSSHNQAAHSSSLSSERPTDPRYPPSPVAKDRDPPIIEPRYADNYEKHPRGHPRDSHQYNSNLDPNPLNSAFSRNSHNDANNSEDRNSSHYQQRSYVINPVHADQPTDPRRENSELYRGMSRDNQQNAIRPLINHSTGRSGDPCNQSQWGQEPNYQSPPQAPNMQYPQRPDMWPMNPVPNNMDPHMMGDPSYMRPTHYPAGQNTCGRPMLSPQDMNHGPCMDQGFREDIPNQSMIPPLIPPTQQQGYPGAQQGYPGPGSQYRNFAPENRPSIQQFDRPQDFPHPRQPWEQQQPINRPSESYPRPAASGQWNRPNRGGPPQSANPVPPPLLPGIQVNRDRNFNDRSRADAPRSGSFNRDPRTRVETPVPPPSSNPRSRVDPPLPSPTFVPSSASGGSNARREPNRFSKDVPSGSKPKDSAAPIDRNARRNSRPESKDTSKHIPSRDSRKSNETKRPPYAGNEKKGRKEPEIEKSVSDKASKDVMQSPLESLYGVIDTAAKTGKGYGIQKFKIPKIKKTQPALPKIVEGNVEESWDLPDESSTNFDEASPSYATNEASTTNVGRANRSESDDKKAEVTSTTCDTQEEATIVHETGRPGHNSSSKSTPARQDDSMTIDAMSKDTEETDAGSEESESLNIEKVAAVIVKSLSTREGLAMLLKGALQGAKNKDIQELMAKIGDEENGNSDTEEPGKNKKTVTKRKKIKPISDSSEEECLAERIAPSETGSSDKTRGSRVDHEENNDVRTSTSDSPNRHSSASNAEILNDASASGQDALGKKSKPFRRKKLDKTGKADEPAKEQSTVPNESAPETAEDPDPKPAATKAPSTKTKLKRRNSFEMLQEDVREMFISEEVVTANGHRMCRIIKEAQAQNSMANNFDSSMESLTSHNTRNKSTGSLDRQGIRGESDGDDAPARPASTRGRRNRGRSRRRNRGRRAARPSPKVIASSDSEEDDSTRTEISGQNDATKNSDESARSNSVGDSSKNKDESEDMQFLRRSERVTLRESMKEPRIHIPKSDLGKTDSSKTMFDSSSDESFTIDVSELTAAVDISLHPDPQALTSSSPKPSSARTAAARRKRMSRRGNSGKTTEDRVENVASADEMDSIGSDLSRASSLTRGKRPSAVSSKPDTNEEMLSDFLTSLGDAKNSGVDNEIERGATPAVDGRATRRKKKKKPSWSLGIVKNKRRKKKLALNLSTDAEAAEGESAELEVSFETSGDTKTDPSDATLHAEIEPKEEILSDSSVPKSSADIGQADPSSPMKNRSAEPKSSNLDDFVDEKKPGDDLLTADGHRSDLEIEPNQNGPNFSVRKLMGYVWSAKKDKFQCLFCTWNGKNVVHHYTISHSGQEVMISRLSIPESKRAISQATTENYEKSKSKLAAKVTRRFTCRFCVFTIDGTSATAIEAFYEHCTTHTGEYRFRCNSCPYQTVARSSMKTHYYRKVCANKFAGNIGLSLSEDSIPDEHYVCGYICSKCNFVQLKEANVRRHIKMTHEQAPGIEMVKINMSSYVEKDLWVDELKIEEEPSAEPELNVTATVDDASRTILAGRITEGTDNMDIVDEALKNEEKTIATGLSNPVESTSLAATSSQEGPIENPPIAGNLSAFVCPPELENKEAEIQHERRKKMQEVVENIGISNKASEKRDLSIIDKLKDKMTTDLDESMEAARTLEANQEIAATVAAEAPAALPLINLPVLVTESVVSLAAEESKSRLAQGDTGNTGVSRDIAGTPIKNEPLESTGDDLAVPNESGEAASDDRTEKKLKDPLANLDEERKDESSDGDETDNDDAIDHLRSYDSDSTSEQSDCENLHADVDSLLGGINPSTNAPIMTTIQRLAAQLQSEKTFPVGEATGDKTETPDVESAKLIPKPPRAVPIAFVQRFIGKRNAVLEEVAREIAGTSEQNVEKPPSSPPKKFIRLRRLSGDKLSVPSPVETTPVESPSIGNSRSSSLDDASLDTMAEVVPTGNDEAAGSFLRISNVVSLAGFETSANEAEMQDLHPVVGSSSVKAPVSVIKKTSVSLLKRTDAIAPIGESPNAPNLSVLPLQPSLAGKNAKFVRIVSGRTSLKQKDSTHRVFGSSMKTPDKFKAMLNYGKLRHFYKCMANDCCYTTDCEESFGRHYRRHKATLDRTKASLIDTYDFQRCAYCTETLSTWNAMCEHLKDKHMYCQYQCSYCFYRALAQSYVELHQMTVHQNHALVVLLGKPESPPIEVIDRREFVIPFICQHECGKSFYVPGAFLAHLKTKHGNSLSIFKCHLCPAPLFNAEKLVAHYKLHGIYKYQCLYCLFGSEQSADVHAHLSASHYNRPPHILERTLQPRPVRDKDVIQQLVVLNVDENYKCTEVFLSPDQKDTDVPRNKHWLQVDRNTSDGSAVGQITMPISNIGMNRLFPYEKLDPVEVSSSIASICNPAAPIITKFHGTAKILPMKSPENMLIVDDTGSIKKVAKQRREIVFPSPAKDSDGISSAAESSAKAQDPLEMDNDSREIEEFTDSAVTDDSRFLGLPEARASTSSLGDQPAIEESDDKNDDSDIEILEDIPVSPSKSASRTIKTVVSVPAEISETPETPEIPSVPIVKEDLTEEASISETPGAEPVIVCGSAENSLDTSVTTNAAEEIDNNFVKPASLEDIKNTGFTGRDLYRCGCDGCDYGAETSALLRAHTKECLFATEMNDLNCVHCSKRFMKIGFLLEHFKIHGLKRFGCSLCNDRWPISHQAMNHMKSKHRQAYPKLVPADPKNPSVDGLFVVHSAHATPRDRHGRKKRGRVKSMEGFGLIGKTKLSFGPTEIDSLPRQPIYQREVHCAVCLYKTKVRTNIIRHLQLHAKDETVPESGPVNPVPCLDKKEKMFDKMVNLASSSHQNGRMGGMKIKDPVVDNDAEFLPKFVPEHKRYVCGVTECNYLSIDEVMLRTHLKALHPDELYFRCPHCPAQTPGHEAQNIAIDKMGIHLKMHDTRLYKCSHCNHHHSHRHVVERHLADKHQEANPYVKVIREPENTEPPQQQSIQEEADEGAADPEGNHWKCNVCEYKCVYKAEMVSHASSSHEEKSQFKCTLCHYKSNNKINFDQHVNAKHGNDPSADYTMVYQKIKGIGGTKRPADIGDAGPLSEPFDTTPLWRRDPTKIRSIRGILFEDEDISQPGSSPVKSGKRKNEADLSARSGKLKTMKTAVGDPSRADDNESLWSGSVETSSSDRRYDASDDFIDVENLGSEALEPSRLVRKFAPYGSPVAHFFQCTICQTFKTKYKHDMRDHLYRDLKYWRYRCALCGYTGVSKNAALKHFMRTHENRRPTEDETSCLPVNFEIETWVQTLLKSQTAQMRGMAVDADGNIKAESLRPMKVTPTKSNAASITQSPLKDTSLKAKTVDLTQAITDMRTKTLANDTESGIHIAEDEDSNDNNALVIDSKDDGLEEGDMMEESSLVEDGDTSVDSQAWLSCKHCTMKFARLRGLKIHVQLRHLRRLAFLCPYCDTSSNSENIMRKHIALKHVGRPETIVPNPRTNLPELTNEFWEKEYGAVIPERPKKRKRTAEETAQDQLDRASGPGHVCNVCGFRAINTFGLGVHMRVHTAVKSFKCAYCSFAATEKVQLWQHSEINHWNVDWKVGNGHGSVPGTSEEILNAEASREYANEDSNDYADNSGSTSGEARLDLVYACFYCNTSRKTVEAVREHWKTAHKITPKVDNGDPTLQRSTMPFRYKEVAVNPLKKILRCGYCPKRGSAASIRLHSRKKHSTKPVKFVEIPAVVSTPVSPPRLTTPSTPTLPEGWICQWCKEFCDSEETKISHQNMFHSHLPASYKRQDATTTSADADEEAANCPECSFRTPSLVVMQRHVIKHLNNSRCTRCDKTFPYATAAVNHNRQAHRGEISKIETFVPNIDKIMARVKWPNAGNSGRPPVVPRSQGVAKKSTTKSLLLVNPTPSDYRAVARKSTRPLPRYPPGIRFSTEGLETTETMHQEAVSYYGKPRVPVNLENISTYITLAGGRQIKLGCTALAPLFDIEPRVMVEDIKATIAKSAQSSQQ